MHRATGPSAPGSGSVSAAAPPSRGTRRRGRRTLHHADGSGRALGLQRSASPAEPRPDSTWTSSPTPRLHLGLFTGTAEEHRTQVQRLISPGARTVGWHLYPPGPDFVVLADPDGNLFCVVDLSHAPSNSG
ncbi:VOC family protein [Streptomyces sp. SID4919]|nr:VOC family protein [Streptomyces sp. SID4919]